eukprot:2809256-Rhodomonas_salina.2
MGEGGAVVAQRLGRYMVLCFGIYHTRFGDPDGVERTTPGSGLGSGLESGQRRLTCTIPPRAPLTL